MARSRLVFATLLLLLTACEKTAREVPVAPTPPRATGVSLDYNVVLLLIDGPRYSETFGDPAHVWVDQMWNQLRPAGTICTNFRNLGATYTVPGHSAVLTGVWQNIANDGSERPDNPTLFEYFRKATGAPQSDVAIVSTKTKLAACAYSDHPAYGAAYGASEDLGHATDEDTFDELMTILQTDQPRLVMASFSQVDQIAHGGSWSNYLNQIEIVDGLVTQTWNALQADPHYAGRTYMFVSADHGRHDDDHGGFRSHGDNCDGCRHLIFLALGPGIRAGHEVTNLYTQRDICETVGSILGVGTPHSDGTFMGEIFEPVSSGVVD